MSIFFPAMSEHVGRTTSGAFLIPYLCFHNLHNLDKFWKIHNDHGISKICNWSCVQNEWERERDQTIRGNDILRSVL
jgi:hypothetical protein